MTVINSTASTTDSSPSRTPTPSKYYLCPAKPKSAGGTPTTRYRSASRPRSVSRSDNSRNWRQKSVDPQLPDMQHAWASFQRKCTPQKSHKLQGHRKSNSATNAAEMQVAGDHLQEPRRNSYSCTYYTPPSKRANIVDGARPKEPSPKQERGLVGKLRELSTRFFKEAYGLNNTQRREHSAIIEEAYELTGCSERAIRELLYGHSYGTDSELKALRDQVPGYPQKLPQKNRAAQLQRILKHPEQHPFLTFDGNKAGAADMAQEEVSSQTAVASPRSGFMGSFMRFVRTSLRVS